MNMQYLKKDISFNALLQSKFTLFFTQIFIVSSARGSCEREVGLPPPLKSLS